SAGVLLSALSARYDEVLPSVSPSGSRSEDGVMLDYQIQPNTRRCTVTGRELQAGEKFFSVLLEQEGKLIRQDFSHEVWQGPPEGAFSFWSGRAPRPQARRRLVIDDDLLLDCFHRLEGQTE